MFSLCVSGECVDRLLSALASLALRALILSLINSPSTY